MSESDLPYIPRDIVSKIISISDISIDTYLELKKNIPTITYRKKKIYIDPKLKKKLNTINKRRSLFYSLGRSDVLDCYMTYFEGDIDSYKLIDIIIRNNEQSNIIQIELNIKRYITHSKKRNRGSTQINTQYAFDLHTGETIYASTIP